MARQLLKMAQPLVGGTPQTTFNLSEASNGHSIVWVLALVALFLRASKFKFGRENNHSFHKSLLSTPPPDTVLGAEVNSGCSDCKLYLQIVLQLSPQMIKL